MRQINILDRNDEITVCEVLKALETLFLGAGDKADLQSQLEQVRQMPGENADDDMRTYCDILFKKLKTPMA